MFLLAVAASALLLAAAAAAERTAVVFGVGRYDNGPPLANAEADARAIAAALAARGFETELFMNPTRAEILRALAVLRLRSESAELAVIWFSGHGVWAGGGQLLLPSDARFHPEGLARSAVPLEVLVRAIADRPRQKLIFVDACRELPGLDPAAGAGLAWAGPAGAGLAGLRIEFASQPGAPAFDGAGQLSPFAAAWVRALAEGPPDLESASRKVRLEVIRATGGVQIPWSRSSLLRPILLLPGAGPSG